MRIDTVCFTDQGYALGERLADRLRGEGDAVRLERCGGGKSVRQWTEERFHDSDALVFIGAIGIAVRAVAPLLVSKTSDPAVVAIDDCGRFSVSLLSGHIGGANDLANRIALLLGATPVVTTATDSNSVFAVDDWAERNNFFIVNPGRIKSVSAELLAGREVGLRTAFPIAGPFPENLVPQEKEYGVSLDIRPDADSAVLSLIAPVAVLGVGCRKNAPAESIESAFRSFCGETGIHPKAFAKACSIDLKKNEPGLIAFCEKQGLSFETFPAETLAEAGGEFSSSDFVASVTGVGTVCERAAVVGSGGGRLIAGKTILDSVAMAAAMREYTVDFAEGGWV